MSKMRDKSSVNKTDATLTLLIILLFVAGIGFVIYPDVANYFSSLSHAGILEQYEFDVSVMLDDEVDRHFMLAQEYNNSLVAGVITDPFIPGSGIVVPSNYEEILNINQVMARIEIPVIDVSLPIFHTTTDEVLHRGIGHIPLTPFPVGQMGKHAVLTGHTGTPSSRLFTDLELLKLGDVFIVTVLGNKLMYEVDDISVVLPHEIGNLRNVAHKDLVTLVTCTPYAINSHRLLIRGQRVVLDEHILEEIEVISSVINWRLITATFVTTLFLLGWIFAAIKRKNQRKSSKNDFMKEI